MNVCPACGPANTLRNHPEMAPRQPTSIIPRILARLAEIEYENNLNAAWKRGEEIAMVDSECNRSAMDQSAANEAAPRAPEPSDGLTEKVLNRLLNMYTDPMLHALVAAARERNQYTSGDYVREQSDKLAQAEKTIAGLRDDLAHLGFERDGDLNAFMRFLIDEAGALPRIPSEFSWRIGYDALRLSMTHLLETNRRLSTTNVTIIKADKERCERFTELEQRIADARKECEETLTLSVITLHRPITNEEHDGSVGLISGFCHRCRTPWPCQYSPEHRIATILEPPASGTNTKG